jgi:hypothetical protein
VREKKKNGKREQKKKDKRRGKCGNHLSHTQT